MWQQSKIEDQDAPLTPLQKQAPDMALATDEEEYWQHQPDFFRAEALQYYQSQKNTPAATITMNVRFSFLLWLILIILLLSLLVLGMLLTTAGVPILGLGRETIAI